MEDYAIVEAIQNIWPNTPQGVVVTHPQHSFYHLEVSSLWLRVGLTYTREVLQEFAFVIDPHKKIVTDQLITHHQAQAGPNNLFPLKQIGTAITGKRIRQIITICHQAVEEHLNVTLRNPEHTLRLVRSMPLLPPH